MEDMRKEVTLGLPPLPTITLGLPPLPTIDENSSSDKGELSAEIEPKTGNKYRWHKLGPNMEPQMVKRIMASRQYSQKYRLKKIHQAGELEGKMKALEAKVAVSNPQVKFLGQQQSLLKSQNSSMKEQISACSGELSFKEAQFNELKKERDMLKQDFNIQLEQQQQSGMVQTEPAGVEQMVNMKLNDQPDSSQFMETTVEDMVNMNLDQPWPEQNLDMNSLNQDPSRYFM